jgi:hypothetical protein
VAAPIHLSRGMAECPVLASEVGTEQSCIFVIVTPHTRQLRLDVSLTDRAAETSTSSHAAV